MALPTDFCVIGGGIAGLTIARALARSGATVTVVDHGAVGTGASHVAAGMLAPLVEARLEEHSVVRFGIDALQYYPLFVAELQEETGCDVDYRTEGTLVVGIDRDQAEHVRHYFAEQKELGLNVEWLTGYECRKIEPYLSPTIPGGVFSQQDCQIDNRLLLAALVVSCQKSGRVRFIEHVGEEAEFLPGEKRLQYAVSGSSEQHVIEANHFVLATGARNDILARIAPEISRLIRPVKGEILRLDQTGMHILDHVVRTPEVYMVPKSDGRIVVGASSEDKGFDERIIAGEVFELLRSAWECLPAVYELPIVETSVGFRPATIDHAPLLGGYSLVENVSFAMGYYRHGILFAPYAAELLARELLENEQSPWLTTFSPNRFLEVL